VQWNGDARFCLIDASKESAHSWFLHMILLSSKIKGDDEDSEAFALKTVNVVETLSRIGFFNSKSDVKRAIKAGNLVVNGEKVNAPILTLNTFDVFVFGKGGQQWALVAFKV
jgi:hypothetical protein